MKAKRLVSADELEQRVFIRPKELAAISGIAESVVYRAVQSGQLPARKFREKAWLIKVEDADAWIEANSVSNAA